MDVILLLDVLLITYYAKATMKSLSKGIYSVGREVSPVFFFSLVKKQENV